MKKENVINFLEEVRKTRVEGSSVSIRDIAKCFKDSFDSAELEALIKELK